MVEAKKIGLNVILVLISKDENCRKKSFEVPQEDL